MAERPQVSAEEKRFDADQYRINAMVWEALVSPEVPTVSIFEELEDNYPEALQHAANEGLTIRDIMQNIMPAPIVEKFQEQWGAIHDFIAEATRAATEISELRSRLEALRAADQRERSNAQKVLEVEPTDHSQEMADLQQQIETAETAINEKESEIEPLAQEMYRAMCEHILRHQEAFGLNQAPDAPSRKVWATAGSISTLVLLALSLTFCEGPRKLMHKATEGPHFLPSFSDARTPNPSPEADEQRDTPVTPDRMAFALENPEPRFYRVMKGDNVSIISRKTGVNPDDIIALNNLRPPYTIHPGKDLRIRHD